MTPTMKALLVLSLVLLTCIHASAAQLDVAVIRFPEPKSEASLNDALAAIDLHALSDSDRTKPKTHSSKALSSFFNPCLSARRLPHRHASGCSRPLSRVPTNPPPSPSRSQFQKDLTKASANFPPVPTKAPPLFPMVRPASSLFEPSPKKTPSQKKVASRSRKTPPPTRSSRKSDDSPVVENLRIVAHNREKAPFFLPLCAWLPINPQVFHTLFRAWNAFKTYGEHISDRLFTP